MPDRRVACCTSATSTPSPQPVFFTNHPTSISGSSRGGGRRHTATAIVSATDSAGKASSAQGVITAASSAATAIATVGE